MAIEEDEAYLILTIATTAVVLVLLWYLSARLRHRRQANSMTAAVSAPETIYPGQRQTRNGRRRGNQESGMEEPSQEAVTGAQRQKKSGNRSGGRDGDEESNKKVVVKTSRSGEEFTFFWGPNTFLSQWHQPCGFEVAGITYNCAEQYMMHQKACLFKDDAKARDILLSDNPKEQKALGRGVANFDKDIWNIHCKKIVKDGNLAKFRQNPRLCEELMNTGSSTLVEASPYDRIWGIGLSSSNPKAMDKMSWRGSNWMGVILMQVREELRKEAKA